MNTQLPTDWNNFRNILCIRPDNLGDVVMTSPAIRALKNALPDRKITLWTSNAGNNIAQCISEIDETIIFEIPWEKKQDHIYSMDVLNFIELLRAKKFDAAVIFTVYSQNPLPLALVCYLAGIPRVAGYCRENPYHLLSDWIPEFEPIYNIRHEVVRQLELSKILGADVSDNEIRLNVDEKKAGKVLTTIKNLGINIDSPWLVMHPGVSEIRRQYPSELYAEAAAKIIKELGFQIVLTGTKEEWELCESIRHANIENIINTAGVFDIEEFIILLGKTSMLIANNTGPVHLAAAVKTPVIVMYALTNPQHLPWKVRSKILPFDVPPEMRSKNVIVKYAYEQSFFERPGMVSPDSIYQAVKQLQTQHKNQFVEMQVLKI